MLKITQLAAIATAFAAHTAQAYGPFNTPATSYIDPGDRIVLNQSVSVTAGSKIYIQNGEVKLRYDVRESKPYCYFNLYRSSAVIDSAASLQPETFEIEATANRYEYVSRNAPALQLASGGFFTQEASQQTLLTRFKLQSGDQPEVTGLHCGIWAVPNERNHLGLEEIRTTLGSVVTLLLGSDQ